MSNPDFMNQVIRSKARPAPPDPDTASPPDNPSTLTHGDARTNAPPGGQPLPAVAEPPCQPLTPRRATWLVLRRERQRTEAEAQQLAQLRAQQAEVAEAVDLAEDFATLVRQRQPAQLDPWLQRATASTLEALQRFAQGLYEDYEAVRAGVTVPWSTGPVEGHINRLKMLKRQMFGRAHLDLLSRRFVGASGRTQTHGRDQSAPVAAHTEAAAA